MRRLANRKLGPAVGAILALTLLGTQASWAGATTHGPEPALGAVTTRTESPDKAAWTALPRLRGGLVALADAAGRAATNAADAADAADAAGAGEGDAATRAGSPATVAVTPVHIRLAASRDAGPVGDAVRRLRGVVKLSSPDAIEALVPAGALAALARTPGVVSVWPIVPRPHRAVVSAGASIHGVAPWHAAGLDGTGVRIGIIDGGFAGLAERVGSEIRGPVVARCYTGLGVFTTSLDECANGDTHGTAVAETIADMAPGASLYVADPTSPLEEAATIDWFLANGVRIVNASYASGFIFDGPGDGSTPYPDTSYAAVERAVAGGALWVNAAGNEGDGGWTGAPADADDDGWIEFAPGDEDNAFELFETQAVGVAIRWSEPWGASATDYDLYLFEEGGVVSVGSSLLDQNGFGDPYELIAETLPRGRYEIGIVRHAGAPTARLQLLVYGLHEGLERQVAAGTLPSPADSASAGMVTVGAVKHSSPGTIEPYSSRGPTLDGRVKPDLVAVDCAATSIVPIFCGTSQATPHVAGAAALLLAAEPAIGPTALAERLRRAAVGLGTPIPNSTFGWGRLALGEPPASPPTAVAFVDGPAFEVPGRAFAIEPVVHVLDANGRTVTRGPGATVAVTLAATSGQLTCPAGTTQAASAGIVRFAGCSISAQGAVALTAGATGLTPGTWQLPVLATAAPAATIAVTASATTLARPGPVTFSVRAGVPAGSAAGASGRLVEIQGTTDGVSWRSMATATTGPDGAATVAASVGRSGSYRAVFRGAADLASAAAVPIRIAVRQTVVLRPTSITTRAVALGARTTFRATVRPLPLAGVAARVSFQVYRRVSGTWRLAASRTVTADTAGVATLVWRWGTRGSWYVRASALATSANAASTWSRNERYDVR